MHPADEYLADLRYKQSPDRKASWFFKHSAECVAMRQLVHRVLLDSLDHPGLHRWSMQGFGMLRMYLEDDKRLRLNLWDSDLMVPNVSMIHDHPWHFDSWVLSGTFTNRRYLTWSDWLDLPPMKAEEGCDLTVELMSFMEIKTGEGGGPSGTSQHVRLVAQPDEVFTAGDTYHQDASEIHKSIYTDGCVTLNDRERIGDGEHARVFWPASGKWVDAKPREATFGEKIRTIELALNKWSTVDHV